jgi:hypothetical protein
VRLEGSGQLRNPTISPGIEPATSQFVSQCLNELRYRIQVKIKVNNFKVIPVLNHYAMKTYEACPFLTYAIDGGEWSASRPCRFTPRGESH